MSYKPANKLIQGEIIRSSYGVEENIFIGELISDPKPHYFKNSIILECVSYSGKRLNIYLPDENELIEVIEDGWVEEEGLKKRC